MQEQVKMNADENQIVVYQPNETVRLDVRLENRTVWLSQKQMAELFGCSSENIIVHLKKIYREEELSEAATAKENLVVQTEGNRTVSRRIRFIRRSRRHRAKMGPEIIPGLLDSIRKATTGRREYTKLPKSRG